ncbi:hypothetical protein [Streptomyces sp. NPDC057910]
MDEFLGRACYQRADAAQAQDDGRDAASPAAAPMVLSTPARRR